jgi:putative ABC transport system permease protein
VLRLLRLCSFRPARRRPLRALLAVVAVAAGTAMAVSVVVVRSSVSTSVTDFSRELAGPTELRVVGATRRGGLEADVAQRVADVEGVAAAVPVVQAVTIAETTGDRDGGDRGGGDRGGDGDGGVPVPSVDDAMVLAIGLDCRAELLVGDIGCDDALVADRGDRPLGVGPGVDGFDRLRTNLGTVPLADVPTFAGLDGLGGGRFVVFGLATAQRVFDRQGRLDAVYVQPEDGVDVAALRAELERVVGPQNGVLTAAQGPPEVDAVVDSVLPLFTLLALFALATGAMLVYNTVTLSLEERRRELAVLGALGGTPQVVTTTTLAEAGLLGAVGGLVGAIGGVLVAGPIVVSLSEFTERTGGIPLEVHAGPVALAIGAVLGVVVALLAAAVPIRRALRLDVAAELAGRDRREEMSQPRLLRRAALWAGVLAAGLVLSWVGQRGGGLERWQIPVAGVGFGLAALGTLLCGASLAPLAMRPWARLLDGSAAGRLAVANLVRAPGRTGVMVVAVATAATTAFVTAGYSNGVQAEIGDNVSDNLDGVEVASIGAGANVNVDAGLSPRLLSELEVMPGVAEVQRGASILVGTETGDLVTVSAYQDNWITRRDGDEMVRGRIDAAAFERGEAVINTTLARDTGLRPGDALPLPTPTGVVEVPIQAVTSGGGATGRVAQIPWALHRRLYGNQPARAVTVVPTAGLGIDELAHRVADAYAGQVRIETPDEVVEDVTDSIEAQMAPFWTLQRGLLAVSFVAVLSTLLLVGVQRRREMALLAAVGTAPSTLRRMVLVEAALVGVVGVVLSLVGGIVMLWALLDIAPLMIGWSTPYRPDWLSLPWWGAVSMAVALLAAAWPARRAARTDVVVALRYE